MLAHLIATVTGDDWQFIAIAIVVGVLTIFGITLLLSRVEDMQEKHRQLDDIVARYADTEAGETR